MKLSKDCLYFLGDRPCIWHKKEGAKCQCEHYIKRGKRILIVKLGAMGDVLRTTPLIRKLKAAYPNCEITWITYFPELLKGIVEFPLELNAGNLAALQADKFNIIYNLDKDREACAIINLVKADEKQGFKLQDGRCEPINRHAEHKFFSGVDDDYNRETTKSYYEEIFEICGFKYEMERYLLQKQPTTLEFPKFKKIVIGLNTGCSPRWKTRMWPDQNWVELAKKLKTKGYDVIFLGGELEDSRNKEMAKKTGAFYFGIHSFHDFVNIVDQCTLVVTAVTMAMHLSIALNKKLVVYNNIFNRHEFELYGLGKIIQPKQECKCFFKNNCTEKTWCMETLSPDMVSKTVDEVLKEF